MKFTHKTPKMTLTQSNSPHVHVVMDKGGKPHFADSQPSSRPNNGKSRFEIAIGIGHVHITGPRNWGAFRRGRNYTKITIKAWFRE